MSGVLEPDTKEGYRLLHQGARALARVESTGIRIDIAYLESAIKKADQQIKDLEAQVMSSDVMKVWRKMYGAESNLRSRQQMGGVMLEVSGDDLPKTDKGRVKTDEDSLSKINHPFIKTYVELEKLRKARSTYLEGLKREAVDGLIHPFFNLHTASTYRSSCDSPNFQNIPIRNPKIGGMIRRAFIPRRGNRLIEIDFGGIEVRISACYNHDPVLIDYIKDPTKDMHRDMASECYLLPQDEITKELRYAAKNQFVFPEFYGDWFASCAPQLWESMLEAKTKSGRSVLQHLAKKGIDDLGLVDSGRGSFMDHIRSVEARFWGERFKVYAKWRRDWVKRYERLGYLKLLSGFTCRTVKGKNGVTNYPIQGSAFHCLLWSLIRIVLFELKKRKMKSLVVGQIHDSLIGDTPENEVEAFKEMAIEVMTKLLPEAWKWIIVPLVVEITTYKSSWAEKDE
jgi:DNA polymerase-1